MEACREETEQRIINVNADFIKMTYNYTGNATLVLIRSGNLLFK